MRALFGPPPPVAARWHPVSGLAGCATPSGRAMAPKRPKLALLVHTAVGPPRNVLPEVRPRYCSVTREAPVQSQCGIALLFRGLVMFLSEVRSPFYAIQDKMDPALHNKAHAPLLVMTLFLGTQFINQRTAHADGLSPQSYPDKTGSGAVTPRLSVILSFPFAREFKSQQHIS